MADHDWYAAHADAILSVEQISRRGRTIVFDPPLVFTVHRNPDGTYQALEHDWGFVFADYASVPAAERAIHARLWFLASKLATRFDEDDLNEATFLCGRCAEEP